MIWTEEDAIAATEIFIKNGGTIDDTKAPFRQYFALYQLDLLEYRHKTDKACLMMAIQLCAKHGLIMPEWVAAALNEANREIFALYEKHSWDEVFGKPREKGSHSNSLKKRRFLTVKVWKEVNKELEINPETPIDTGLFEKIGKSLGISKTVIQEYYYSIKKGFPKDKGNQLYVVVSRGGNSCFKRPKK